MKKLIAIAVIVMAGHMCAYAQVDSYVSSSVVNKCSDGSLRVEADMKSSALKSDESVLVIPYLYTDTETLELPYVEFRGRRRFFDWLRHGKQSSLQPYSVLRASGKDEASVHYDVAVPFVDWMSDCSLGYTAVRKGCNCRIPQPEIETKYAYKEEKALPRPQFVYAMVEKEEEKIRTESGTARVQFPVNEKRLIQDFGSNPEELQKILSTVNAIAGDRDITIDHMSLKGYASPEGPYAQNEKLANGRVESIKAFIEPFVQNSSVQIDLSYEVEDWAGVKEYVEKTQLPHKQEILSTIEEDIDLDSKDWRIKLHWPDDYAFLLNECYPSLRRTDYVIEYTVRQFNDNDDLKTVFSQNPSKLSLYELMTLANTYDQDSYDFQRVMTTSAAIYPNSEEAIVNAANVAMSNGDLSTAEQLLFRCGESGIAVYARGILQFLSGDFESFAQSMAAASELGIKEATDYINEMKSYNTL